jgi:hypothetical protein
VALIGSHYLFYDRWNNNGKFYSAVDFATLIFFMEEIAEVKNSFVEKLNTDLKFVHSIVFA